MTEKQMLCILALAGLALLVPAGADAAARTNALTLTVREGQLYRDGKPFRAFGSMCATWRTMSSTRGLRPRRALLIRVAGGEEGAVHSLLGLGLQ